MSGFGLTAIIIAGGMLIFGAGSKDAKDIWIPLIAFGAIWGFMGIVEVALRKRRDY